MRAAELKYGEDLVVLFIDEEENIPLVEEFAGKYGLVSPFLMDYTGDIGREYRLFSTPTTYFLDAHGVVQSIRPGVIDMNWIDENVEAGL